MNAIKATMNVCCFRTFGLIAALAAVLLPVQAYALSLGGFQVESALDEPLKGEIQLESVDPETLESLEVTLGSAEDFRRADVPRQEFLNQLQFTVTETPDGGALVEVTSEQPMKEPFLHFLVSVEWRGGQFIREYTGLLDPPLYAGESPAQVESPAVATAEATPEMDEPSEPAAEPAAAETGTVSAITPSSDAGAAEYGPTQEGDTLWDIASRLDTGAVQANVFQIMIALQRQNPDAFIDNNINRLRTGAVLRLDDVEAVADISADQASAAYTAQLEEWQSYRSRVASAEAGDADTATVASNADTGSAAAAAEDTAQADEAMESTSETTTAQAAADTAETPEQAGAAQAGAEGQDDVLRIVQATVDESQQSEGAGGGTGADQSGEIAELRGQIATLQESLESRNLENEELRERVSLLESQLENAQRLIEIESQELAAAQEQAAQAQEQAAQAREQASQTQAEAEAEAQAQAAEQSEPAAAESAADSEPTTAEPVQPVEESGQEQMAAASTAEDTAGAGETDTASAAQSSSAGDSSTAPETQSSEPASAAGSAAAQSGQSGDDAQRVRTTSSSAAQGAWWTRITDMLFSSWMWMVGAAIGVLVLVLGLLMFLRRRQSIAEFEESILSGSALDSYSETSDTAASSASDTSFLSDFGTAGMGTMQADEVDPLAEAEVYLAYGRDEQAEDVLKEAARRDPERAEVKLKLLEIYKQRNDVKSFETIAEELYPAGDSGDRQVWNQVTAMGRELSPGNPLFQESAAAGEAPAPTPEAPAAGSAEAGSAEAGREDTGEAPEAMNFNFDDLGGQAPEQEQAPAASAVPAGGTRAGNELDFDLDTGMAPESETPAPAAASHGDESTLDFGEDFLQQPSGSVDPATQPFPAPDQQTDLDRELERLAGEREATAVTPPDDAQAPAAGADQASSPAQQPDWERADDDSGTLDFPTSDTADIDFDLDLDDTSIQQLTGSDSAQKTAGGAQAAGGDGESVSEGSLEDVGEGLLEFESENIPPEETWAGPSSDTAPAADDEAVAYSPSDDVQSAGAPEYNEAETKLDLARAYLDMGDKVGARSIIDEVMREGDPAQRDQAAELAAQL